MYDINRKERFLVASLLEMTALKILLEMTAFQMLLGMTELKMLLEMTALKMLPEMSKILQETVKPGSSQALRQERIF